MDYDMSKDFEFYVENQAKLVKEYNKKYIIINNCKVDSEVFDDIDKAIEFANKKYGEGKFFVHFVDSGEDNYTSVLSRVKEYA